MRPTPRRVLKTVCIITVMGFLIMNLNLLVQTVDDDANLRNDISEVQVPDGHGSSSSLGKNRNGSSLLRTGNSSHNEPGHTAGPNSDDSNNNDVKQPHLTSKTPPMRYYNINNPNSAGAVIARDGLIPALNSGPHNSPPELNATFIKDFIIKTNEEQTIYNLDKFDLRAGSETLVIVVQVHNRADYLKHLVDSLRKAKNIEHSLLIFSHDYFDENMNKIVRAIDFCPVLQIFYPYPIQIYPKEFPGEDPNDCPRNMKKAEALQKRCNNAENPDKYGHYREAKYSQTKHHWFWKISHVFDYLKVMKHFTGPVLFIEEDHYLVEDFIPVLHQMFKLAQESCKECSIMTLGTYDKNPTYAGMSRKVDVTDWVSTKHNMGMALNRTIWEKIKKCGKNFCQFDDYNWDWSLQYISLTCIPGRLKVMLSKSPRIYHIGECGVHHKGKRCNSEEKVRQIEGLLTRNKQYLYPDKLLINGYPRSMARMPKPNGGWGDHRDHDLCTQFKEASTHVR